LATDSQIYIRTNEGAPRFRLYAFAPERPERENWAEIVPEGPGTLDAVAVTRHGVVLHELENVRSAVRIRRHDGRYETLGGFEERSLLGMSGSERSEEIYLLAASFLEAPSIECVVVAAQGRATTTTWERVSTPFDPGAYRVDQQWFESKDGTRVPMWVLSHRDTPRDGTAPAVLYGYGGFNVSLTPAFAPSLAPWLDAGGIYAVANLRGGGEFGEAWHRAGMLDAKQNVFDDFIAAAEFLGTSRIADPKRIAVYGGSNGGLLVAALAVQRPELVAAIVCAVPLTDMLRYHLFSIGRLWIAEYGDPDDPNAAAILRAYSPYHNVREGVAYPAMLIETAESDGRVDPLHAKKFGALVQASTAGDAPVLVHVEENAGHGKPREKIVAELADRWGFLGWRLGQRLV
jgi:prolyl oligopeptidase